MGSLVTRRKLPTFGRTLCGAASARAHQENKLATSYSCDKLWVACLVWVVAKGLVATDIRAAKVDQYPGVRDAFNETYRMTDG